MDSTNAIYDSMVALPVEVVSGYGMYIKASCLTLFHIFHVCKGFEIPFVSFDPSSVAHKPCIIVFWRSKCSKTILWTSKRSETGETTKISLMSQSYIFIYKNNPNKTLQTPAKSVQIYAPTLPYFVKYESLTLSGSEESEWMVEILPGRLNTTEDFKLNSKVDLICVLVWCDRSCAPPVAGHTYTWTQTSLRLSCKVDVDDFIANITPSWFLITCQYQTTECQGLFPSTCKEFWCNLTSTQHL